MACRALGGALTTELRLVSADRLGRPPACTRCPSTIHIFAARARKKLNCTTQAQNIFFHDTK